MGVKHIPCVLALILLASVTADSALAITLGEPQAIPSIPSQYVFRLAILTNPHESTEAPAVTVRQPHTALLFIRDNMLELRLRSLTDVELEVSHGGQTLNRLLMKRELQGARARLEATTAWNHYQAAKANDAPHFQGAPLLDTAYPAHRTGGQLDPTGAQHPLAQALRQRQPPLVGQTTQADPIVQEASPPATGLPDSDTDNTPKRATVEREIHVIREEMTKLTARVAPWGSGEAPALYPQGRELGSPLGSFLGGVFIVGVTSLLTGFVMQRRLSDQAAQRHRVMLALKHRGRMAPLWGHPRLALGQRCQGASELPALRRSMAVIRRLRVSRKTTWRVRFHHLPSARKLPPSPPITRTTTSPRRSPSQALTPAALIEALEHLRYDLMNRQRFCRTSSPPGCADPYPDKHTD